MPQASQLDLSQDKISHFVHGSSNIKMPAELEKNMIHQTMELDIDYERAGILHKGQKATLTTYIKEMYPGDAEAVSQTNGFNLSGRRL